MPKTKGKPKKLTAVGLTLTDDELFMLRKATRKFSSDVNVHVSPQKFLLKLLYDHVKQNR